MHSKIIDIEGIAEYQLDDIIDLINGLIHTNRQKNDKIIPKSVLISTTHKPRLIDQFGTIYTYKEQYLKELS